MPKWLHKINGSDVTVEDVESIFRRRTKKFGQFVREVNRCLRGL